MKKREIRWLTCSMIVFLIVSMLLIQVYSPEPGEDQSEIVIEMMHDDVEIKQCLIALANDIGVRIRINVMTDEGDLTDYDSRRNLNMELLSGSGPDILVMDDIDSIPAQNAGIIMDPTPVALSWYLLSWKEDLTPDGSSLRELIDYAEKNSLHFYRGFDVVASLAFRGYISPSLSGNIEKDKGVLERFFQDLRRLRNLHVERHSWASFYQGNEKCSGFSFFEQVAFGEADLAMDYLTGIDDLQELAFLNKAGKLRFSAKYFAMKGSPRCLLAVNKNAKNKISALNYVDYAKSKEGQETVAQSGSLPVDLEVLYRVLQQLDSRTIMTPEYTIEIERISKDDIEKICPDLPASMGEPNDGIVMQQIMLEAAYYLNGEKTIEEAAKCAAERIWLKQNE